MSRRITAICYVDMGSVLNALLEGLSVNRLYIAKRRVR